MVKPLGRDNRVRYKTMLKGTDGTSDAVKYFVGVLKGNKDDYWSKV